MLTAQEVMKKYPSLDYVHDRIKEQVDYQVSKVARLDAKASGLIVADVAVAALIINKDVLFRDRWYLGAGIMFLLGLSLLFGLMTIWTVKIDKPPRPAILFQKYLDKTEQSTKYNVTYDLAVAYIYNEEQLKHKMRKFKISVLGLMLSVIVLIPTIFISC